MRGIKDIQFQKQHKDKDHVLPHQPNNNKGWMWMSLYWAVGLIIGTYYDYIPSWSTPGIKTFTYSHMFGLVSTCFVAIPRFHSLYSTHGRQRSVAAALLFAICNGISETMIYLAMYDLGSKWLTDLILVQEEVVDYTYHQSWVISRSPALQGQFMPCYGCRLYFLYISRKELMKPFTKRVYPSFNL